ncbi:MAG: DNA damage-inducible protein D [Selenomonadaceae bacterium]|nr:DNA damage-inducible protein D [Selenomonadaceae bacterium]
MGELEKINETLFESIKHFDEYGQEYWTARELQTVLSYTRWEYFAKALQRAINACESSGNTVSNHFRGVTKMVTLGSGSAREVTDYELSRYACYLIAMNGDSRKKAVALAQTYFAVKTRQQELTEEEYQKLTEDQKRLMIRQQVKKSNLSLAEAAHNAGVETSKEYAIFNNYGYKGLYGGLTAQDIHDRKGLKKSQQILDHMGGSELAANLFRITQTDEKLRRENIQGKNQANIAHNKVGKKVRQTIKELGGTLPENLPTPDKSIKQIERENKKMAKLAEKIEI